MVPCFHSVSADWNILNAGEMRSIAAQAPTSVDDLKSLQLLGDKKVADYGARIVKMVKAYVENQNLQSYLAKRPPPPKRARSAQADKKPPPASKRAIVIEDDDDDDEFEDAIDYTSLNMDSFGK